MVLVVCRRLKPRYYLFWEERLTSVEDDFLIGREFPSDGLPEGLEVPRRGNDTSRASDSQPQLQAQPPRGNLLSSIVVGIEDCISTAIGDEFDGLPKAMLTMGYRAHGDFDPLTDFKSDR